MKTLACMNNPAHGPALDALLASLGALQGAGGDWLLDCGQTSETVIIVVLPAASEADLETTVSTAALKGQRVVGVWAPGAGTELPVALEEYGGSAVSWSAEALRAVICEEQVVWQDPGGGERAPQNPKEKRVLKPRVYSYVMDHDVGFAPNPFHGICTLAACKPQIRRTAEVGDYILGTGSVPSGRDGHLVYWMRVGEVSDFNAYWEDPRFVRKRPQMNGSLMQQHGDNIYRLDVATGHWLQANSFHSRADGGQCPSNTARDTGSTDRVLIADEFAYWGGTGPRVPAQLSDFVHSTQGHRCRYPADRVSAALSWIHSLPKPTLIGRPIHWPSS